MTKNKKLALKLGLGSTLMFGFAYLLVPLYTLLCNKTGLNGRTADGPSAVDPRMQVDNSRRIQVEFTTTVHGDLSFVFKPLVHHVYVHPGEKKLIYFYAQNTTGHPITVQAVPSITPDYAAKHFKKTQCFCFTQQYFFKNERADMPVYFYIDPDVPKDIKAMTLSYTLFDATPYLKKNQKQNTQGRIELKPE